MTKFKFLAVLFALLISASMNGTNYFSLRTASTTPVNDTLRISPTCAGSFCQMYVIANFDGYLDHWFLQFTHANDMAFSFDEPGPEMTIHYVNKQGHDTVYTATFNTNTKNVPYGSGFYYSTFSATSPVYGYWDPDNDGEYDTYGTAKWEPGYHDYMFKFKLDIPDGRIVDSINVVYTLGSSLDLRAYPTVNGTLSKKIYLKVAYLLGDANGDGTVAVDDVATLQHWLMDGYDDVDQYRLAAGDMDGDGDLTVLDVSLLISYVLQN